MILAVFCKNKTAAINILARCDKRENPKLPISYSNTNINIFSILRRPYYAISHCDAAGLAYTHMNIHRSGTQRHSSDTRPDNVRDGGRFSVASRWSPV